MLWHLSTTRPCSYIACIQIINNKNKSHGLHLHPFSVIVVLKNTLCWYSLPRLYYVVNIWICWNPLSLSDFVLLLSNPLCANVLYGQSLSPVVDQRCDWLVGWSAASWEASGNRPAAVRARCRQTTYRHWSLQSATTYCGPGTSSVGGSQGGGRVLPRQCGTQHWSHVTCKPGYIFTNN